MLTKLPKIQHNAKNGPKNTLQKIDSVDFGQHLLTPRWPKLFFQKLECFSFKMMSQPSAYGIWKGKSTTLKKVNIEIYCIFTPNLEISYMIMSWALKVLHNHSQKCCVLCIKIKAFMLRWHIQVIKSYHISHSSFQHHIWNSLSIPCLMSTMYLFWIRARKRWPHLRRPRPLTILLKNRYMLFWNSKRCIFDCVRIALRYSLSALIVF